MSDRQSTITTEEVAATFARAAEARDADTLVGLYHPDGQFWNNVIGRTSDTAQIVEVTRREAEVIAEYVFADQRCTVTPDGFVLQMVVTGTTREGAAFAVASCLVAKVTDGLITRVDEYVDSAQAAPLFAALLGSSPRRPA